MPNEIDELQDLRPATVEGQHGHDAALVKTHLVSRQLPENPQLGVDEREGEQQLRCEITSLIVLKMMLVRTTYLHSCCLLVSTESGGDARRWAPGGA